MLFRRIRHIHFVGIGGIGMSGIAKVLLSLGMNFRVTGSDVKRSAITDSLEEMGATIWEGHAGEHIAGADVVVCSSAVRNNNPEVVTAHQRLIPVIPRAEMLAELMRLYRYGIAVAGTHGKTTTTSMISHMMTLTNFDPTIVVGGRVTTLAANAQVGHGDYIVVEADQSDGSLLQLTPTIAVLTNIDADHLDHFTGGIEEIKECFVNFANRVPFYGTIVLCLDDQNVQAIIPKISRRTVSYGLAAQADVSAWNIQLNTAFGSEFTVRAFGKEMGQVKLWVPGLHNVYNALATIAVGLDLNIEFDRIAEAMSSFQGAERRFQIEGINSRVLAEQTERFGHRHVEYIGALANAASRLKEIAQPHDLVLTLGAGNVYQAGDELLRILE